MKSHPTTNPRALTLSCVLLLAFSGLMGCTKNASVLAQPGSAKYEELPQPVPPEFTDAEQWNNPSICPEGSQLSPLTRFAYEPGQKNYGFTHYYGRSCNVVTARESDSSVRALASPKVNQMTSTGVRPHGPFIWWYENGKRMSAGNFDHGTLASDWSRWEPDGSLASK